MFVRSICIIIVMLTLALVDSGRSAAQGPSASPAGPTAGAGMNWRPPNSSGPAPVAFPLVAFPPVAYPPVNALSPAAAAPSGVVPIATSNPGNPYAMGAGAWGANGPRVANSAAGVGLPPATPVLATGTPATATPPRAPIAKVTNGSGTLPNDAGQVWREYDISPYTARVTSTARPEQAIIDWVLRDTGYETWHSQPVGLLSADSRTLRVYHTPQVQRVVGEMVDRFVNGEAETHGFAMRVISLGSPNWRSKAAKMLHSVPTQTQGVQAWLVAREDAALVVSELKKRSDYREHSSPQLLVSNGQSTVVSDMRPKTYVRNVNLKPVWPGFEQELGQVEEGFAIEFSPLLAIDGKTIDAVVKCNIDQVEKMTAVAIDAPTAASPRQHTQIEVPQISSARLQERFRWPTDQVLLVSLGMVAPPMPIDPAVKIPLTITAPKADVLLMIESKGVQVKPSSTPAGAPAANAKREAPVYNGRY